jgi:hypothetical protein
MTRTIVPSHMFQASMARLESDASEIQRYDAKRYLHSGLEQLPDPSAASELRPHVNKQMRNERTAEHRHSEQSQ